VGQIDSSALSANQSLKVLYATKDTKFELPLMLAFGKEWHLSDNYVDMISVSTTKLGVAFNIVDNALVFDSKSSKYIPFPDDFVAYLRSNSLYSDVSDPVDVTIGGVDGSQIDVIGKAPQHRDFLVLSGTGWAYNPPPAKTRFILLDNVAGKRILIFILGPDGDTAPDFNPAIEVLNSIKFSE